MLSIQGLMQYGNVTEAIMASQTKYANRFNMIEIEVLLSSHGLMQYAKATEALTPSRTLSSNRFNMMVMSTCLWTV
mgnify:CR=1 FL=1